MTGRETRAPRIEGLTWLRQLGAGGFADVHLYSQQIPQRQVAVKVLREPGAPGALAALRAEADTASGLAGVPGVLGLYGGGTSPDGRAYLIMEYCPVTDLGAQARRHPLEVGQALDITVSLCATAQALHDRGLVHRDIKPANVMLNAAGRPVLADFGMAARVGQAPQEHQDGFSPLWAPPEQWAAAVAADPAQDVWSIAATAWALLSGRSPVDAGDGTRTTMGPGWQPRPIGRLDAPAAVETVLRRALSSQPQQRGSAEDLGAALQEARALLAPGPRAAGVRQAVPRAEPDESQEATVLRNRDSRSGASNPDAGPASASGSARRPAWAVLAAAAAVVCAVIVVTFLTQGGTATPLQPASTSEAGEAGEAEDPVDLVPAPVTSLTAVPQDGQITWTWTDGGQQATTGAGGEHAAPEYYTYVIQAPGAGSHSQRADLNSVQVQAVTGENCIEVTAVSKGGRVSDPTRACVQVP